MFSKTSLVAAAMGLFLAIKGKCTGSQRRANVDASEKFYFSRLANVSHTLSARSSFLLASPPTTYPVDAAKVSSFSVCTGEWEPDFAGGSTDIYVCQSNNDPDLTQQVGTYSYVQSPPALDGGIDLSMVIEQFEINGCILQRTGTWDEAVGQPTYGIWTTQGKSNKGCPKASNIADYEVLSREGSVESLVLEKYTFDFKRAVARTPLTTSTHSKE
jgi:hypothetical protein